MGFALGQPYKTHRVLSNQELMMQRLHRETIALVLLRAHIGGEEIGTVFG